MEESIENVLNIHHGEETHIKHAPNPLRLQMDPQTLRLFYNNKGLAQKRNIRWYVGLSFWMHWASYVPDFSTDNTLQSDQILIIYIKKSGSGLITIPQVLRIGQRVKYLPVRLSRRRYLRPARWPEPWSCFGLFYVIILTNPRLRPQENQSYQAGIPLLFRVRIRTRLVLRKR